MTVLAFAAGAALIGLAGWFIASSAVAGLAVTTTFSFMFPSAGVQALAWTRALSRYGERITTHKATLELVATLRTSLFARALRLPRDRVAALRSSELLGRITVDSDAVENLLLLSLVPALAALAALVAAAVVFSIVSVALAVVAVVSMLLTAAILAGLARHQAGAPARRLVAARAQARQSLIETLDGLPELRSYGAEQHAAAEVTRHLDGFARSRSQLTKLAAGGHDLGTLLADFTLLAVVVVAAGLAGTSALSTPAFVAVCLVGIVVFEPIVGIPGAVTALARARAASERLVELFPDGDDPRTGGPTARAATRTTRVEIALEAQDCTFTLAPGDTVLLTGTSGAGKSTILRAIGGQPSPGVHVHFDGVDAACIDEETLTARVAVVAQDAHVFDGTIRENLHLAAPAAGEPDVWAALAAAALDDTVAAFPLGLDTPVGPAGNALSGGQRRRLSVAQGLLCRADVLLLDEPTEGLDARTAARLLAGVRNYDRSAAVMIALHNRQAPELPWTPTDRVHLEARP
jgi:ATP-binding cassette subfamily C protein CydC